jgi:hypothetical protein
MTRLSIGPESGLPLRWDKPLQFVLNVSEIDGEDLLADGHQLRKATNAEIAAIKDVLTNNAAETSWEAWQNGPPMIVGNTATSMRLPTSYPVNRIRG